MKIQRMFSEHNHNKPVVSGYAQVRKKDDKEDFEKHIDNKIKYDKVGTISATTLAGSIPGAILSMKKHGGTSAKRIIAGAAIGSTVTGLSGVAIRKLRKVEEKEEAAKKELLDMYDSLPTSGYSAENMRSNFRKRVFDEGESLQKVLKKIKKNKIG